MFHSPYYSVWECTLKTYKTEGIRAFYRAYTTQLTMNVPFHAFHFTTYEAMQNVTNREREYSPKSHIVSGAVAGATAAALTTPLDVCKTLLNTQESTVVVDSKRNGSVRAITGLPNAFRTVVRIGGPRALFKGLNARIIYQMPGTAISWTVYETFKAFLLERNSDSDWYTSSKTSIPEHASGSSAIGGGMTRMASPSSLKSATSVFALDREVTEYEEATDIPASDRIR